MGAAVVTAIVSIIASLCSSFITWYLTRKKYYTEVDSNLIDNMKNSLEFYEKLSDDNTKRLEKAIERSTELEGEVKELRSQVMSLMNLVCLRSVCPERIKYNNKEVIDDSNLDLRG